MLAARLVTGAVLLAVFAAGLLWLPNRWWGLALVPVLLAAGREWGALAEFTPRGRSAFCAALAASALLLWALPASPQPRADRVVYGAAIAFWASVVPLWLSLGWRVRARAALAAAGWLALVPAWLALFRLQADPPALLALLGVVWVADSAAYASGKLWGRRPLAPSISPGKTWEGLAGAAAAVAVYHVLVSFAAAWPWWRSPGGIALVAGVAGMSVAGDLFESWIKRQAGRKDSGSLLPGHGGVLDRLDSLCAAMPFAAAGLAFVR
jgi:phosphatidate cytidylyltransferase